MGIYVIVEHKRKTLLFFKWPYKINGLAWGYMTLYILYYMRYMSYNWIILPSVQKR